MNRFIRRDIGALFPIDDTNTKGYVYRYGKKIMR